MSNREVKNGTGTCLDHGLIIIIWIMHRVIITRIMDYNNQSVSLNGFLIEVG
jgi:hypothetical protein